MLPSTGMVATLRSTENSTHSMPIFSARAPIPRSFAQSRPEVVSGVVEVIIAFDRAGAGGVSVVLVTLEG
ncbi:hypothetical protein MTE01_16430 [Microbacterium testaceum]|uniref:Uncharacterized protein n=1 Tax=Microbacterium testaceum TaxID=2033 RepID=A0A4Y3QMH0_MICTE|nr:hypothetical protein MTE01_16430 [Microbacterium testaceum]